MPTESHRPEFLLDARPSATRLHRRFCVRPELQWFEGHFPQEPILAGVVQLKWAIEAAASLRGTSGQPSSIQQLKFKSPIRAGVTVDLELELLADGVVVFTYSSPAGPNSSGRLHF